MFIIIWEYQAKTERLAEFEKIYGADGAWFELFKIDREYLGTEFLRAAATPHCYITIDRWSSETAYENFIQSHDTEYKTLDARCAGLTTSETLIGKWETL